FLFGRPTPFCNSARGVSKLRARHCSPGGTLRNASCGRIMTGRATAHRAGPAHARTQVQTMLTEFRFARIAGIDISAHWSLVIVFLLIGLSLGAAVLPAWHPGWNPGLAWA